MTKFTKKILAAASAGTMFLSLASPVLADNTIEIIGNGYDSENEVEVELENETSVYQHNKAIIINDIDADAETGENDANQNTGGTTGILTGNARTSVAISNMLNSNSAYVDCCSAGDTTVKIAENGAESENEVELELENEIDIYQDNFAKVKNEVDADAETGENDANQNTGGDVLVSTGKASTTVEVSTLANANMAVVGGGDNDGGSLSAWIVGNGYDSENEIELELEKETLITQDNFAKVKNEVEAEAETGENDANQNTGGDVLIGTGDAKTWVEVDNMVNFNSAEVDCGCLLDLFAKIGENGADTENEIEAELESEKNVYQGWGEYGNFAFLLNDVDGDSETGENDVDQNTGDPEGDPGILTGDALDHVAVSNSGNVNIYGDGAGFEWPELPEWPEFDFSFSFNLSLSQLLGFLGLV
nr:MAG: hypothetical protein A2V48_03490 [Candidatus Amesbacteria bacterium RBG_19FT_COMBO_48_16]